MNQSSLSKEAKYSRFPNQKTLQNQNSHSDPLTFQCSTFISSYHAVSADRLVNSFKQCFRLTPPRKYHEIRQHIFSNPIMRNINYLSCETKVVHRHTDYYFADEYEAVILLNCTRYHPLHIKYIAEEISETGKLECKQCKTKCCQIKEIAVDAMLWAFHKQINHYQGCILIFNKKEIGQLVKEKVVKQAQASRNKTVLTERQNGVTKTKLVEVQLLQIARDQKLHLEVLSLSGQIERAKGEAAETYKRRYLNNSSVALLANTICFQSFVRIRNPLINKMCIPSTHNHRMIVFSFQNVYFALFTAQTEKVSCRFPGCPNYFDRYNFESNAIVIQEMQSGYYEEEQENLIGMYFMSTYIKNWHLQFANQTTQNNRLSKNYKEINFNQCKARLKELLTTVNLREGASRSIKLIRKLVKSDGGIQLSDRWDGVCKVSLEENSLCPVRCVKCCSLDTCDVYLMAGMFESEKRCILCGWDAKKKQFYDVFYIDLQLLQFIYLQGFAHTLNCNLKQKYYFHNIGYFTPSSLAQKLIAQNKVLTWSSIQTPLKCTSTDICIIDQRCLSKQLPQQFSNHICLIDQKQELTDLKCPKCGTSARVDRMFLYLRQYDTTLIGKQPNKNRQHEQAEQKIKIALSNACHKQATKIIVSADLKLVSRKFPNQFAKMCRKKQRSISKPKGDVDFGRMFTRGNLLLFKYPINIEIDDVCGNQLQNKICVLQSENLCAQVCNDYSSVQ